MFANLLTQLLHLVQLLLLAFAQGGQNESEVEFLVEVVNNVTENAETFILPTNNDQFFASGPVQDFGGSFDFIIIGSGAGGSVAASRLSEVSQWNVLVLEAGTFGNAATDIPSLYAETHFSSYNWGYNTTSQTTSCLGMVNQQCFLPRGRGVGGSSLVNGLVYIRGNELDYNTWANLTNDQRWSYNSVLPLFKKNENYVHNDPAAPVEPQFHGEGGAVQVEYHLPRSPQLNLFLEAGQELGFNIVDYNANLLGLSPSQINTIHGQRDDDGKAFIDPILNRTNVKLVTNSFVTKILIDSNTKTAYGVEFNLNGTRFSVNASKEVILSAGSINTPQLLLLSGVGPSEHLQSVGIDVVENLQVGSVLRNHPAFFGLVFNTNISAPNESTEQQVEEFINGRGPLAIASNAQGLSYFESNTTIKTGVPDIEIMMVPAAAVGPFLQQAFSLTNQSFQDFYGAANGSTAYILFLVGLAPVSTGTVRLNSSSPFDFPLVDSKYLSDPEDKDINLLFNAIEIGLQLAGTKAFQSIGSDLAIAHLAACSDTKFLSKDFWFCALRQGTADAYHPSGSCPMGTDPTQGAVVDSQLRVFGIKNLRVADASVFPTIPRGHTHTPSTLIGEQLGLIIKEANGIPTS